MVQQIRNRLVALVVKNLRASARTKEMQVQSLGPEDRLQEDLANHSSFLPGESHEQRSLVGCSPQGRRESDLSELRPHQCRVRVLLAWEDLRATKLMCHTS